MQTQKTAPTAGLTVDLKKHRIRIPGRTFEIIDNPEYFRILVNPESMGIVIEGCAEKAAGAYQRSKVPTHKGSYELTSVRLLTEIVRCAEITGADTIKLVGHRIGSQNAVLFHMEPRAN